MWPTVGYRDSRQVGTCAEDMAHWVGHWEEDVPFLPSWVLHPSTPAEVLSGLVGAPRLSAWDVGPGEHHIPSYPEANEKI